MALAEAILVCLTERPMTGYELAKAFDTSIGYFWRAGHQQIYRELQQLSARGLVDREDVIQSGRPNKTVYAINGRGLDHLEAWSREPSDRPPVRDDLFVRLYALDCVDLAAVHAQICDRLAKHKARLALYERIAANRFSGNAKDLRRSGWKIGLHIGMTMEQANITWCEMALATLSEYIAKDNAVQKRARGRRQKASA